MTKSKPPANPHSVKGYKGVQQKHMRKRGDVKKKEIQVSKDNLSLSQDNLFLGSRGLVYPYKPLVLPTELRSYKNGQLPVNRLARVKAGGQMFAPVAYWFNEMYDAALAAGFKLRNEGDYRSFSRQLTLFNDRYSLVDDGRIPTVTRTYEGKTWYLKKGMSPSATPDPTGVKGSNHGWGLAMDLAYEVNDKVISMGGKCLEWLCGNAPKWGFYLQGSDPKSKEFEAWHWQYVLGDESPHPNNTGLSLSTSLPIADMKLDSEGLIHETEIEE